MGKHGTNSPEDARRSQDDFFNSLDVDTPDPNRVGAHGVNPPGRMPRGGKGKYGVSGFDRFRDNPKEMIISKAPAALDKASSAYDFAKNMTSRSPYAPMTWMENNSVGGLYPEGMAPSIYAAPNKPYQIKSMVGQMRQDAKKKGEPKKESSDDEPIAMSTSPSQGTSGSGTSWPGAQEPDGNGDPMYEDRHGNTVDFTAGNIMKDAAGAAIDYGKKRWKSRGGRGDQQAVDEFDAQQEAEGTKPFEWDK